MSLVGIGLVIPEVMNGAGRHIAYLEPATAKLGLQLNFITQPLYLWAITVVKCSIALFLLRIAPTKFYRRLLWGTIIFLIVYTFAAFLTIILQCTNLAIQWDPTVKAKCWTPTTLRSLSYTSSGGLQLRKSFQTYTLLIFSSYQHHYGLNARNVACSNALECSDQRASEGFPHLYYGTRNIVRRQLFNPRIQKKLI